MKTQEQIDNEVLIKERRDAVLEAMESLSEVAPTKTVFGVIAQAERELKQNISSDSTKPKISKEVGRTAYGYQIDTACKPTDSLRLAALEHDEDVDLMLSLRNNKWNHNKTMVDIHSDFFNDKSKALSTKELKTVVRNSTTLSAGLNRVFSYQKLEAEVAQIKLKSQQQELELRLLKGGQLVNSVDINTIKDSLGMKSMTPVDRAALLKENGYTYKEVSEILGVTDRTIKRWLSKPVLTKPVLTIENKDK